MWSVYFDTCNIRGSEKILHAIEHRPHQLLISKSTISRIKVELLLIFRTLTMNMDSVHGPTMNMAENVDKTGLTDEPI